MGGANQDQEPPVMMAPPLLTLSKAAGKLALMNN